MAFFKDKKVLLVDDVINNGTKITSLFDKLTGLISGKETLFKCAAVTIYVFARNIEKNINEKIAEKMSYMVDMVETDVHQFSLMEVQLAHILGLVYYVEAPIFRLKKLSEEAFQELNQKVNRLVEEGHWLREEYVVDLLNKPEWVVKNKYILWPARKMLEFNWPTLSEHVCYSYNQYVDEDGVVTYTINFVPLIVFNYYDFDGVSYFLKRLPEIFTDKESDLLELIDVTLGDFLPESDRYSNIHKVATYLFGLYAGFEFFRELGLSEKMFSLITCPGTEEGHLQPKAHYGTEFLSLLSCFNSSNIEVIKSLVTEVNDTFKGNIPPLDICTIEDDCLYNFMDMWEIESIDLDEFKKEPTIDVGKRFIKAILGEVKELNEKTNNSNEESNNKLAVINKPKKVAVDQLFKKMAIGGHEYGRYYRSCIVPLMECSICSADVVSSKDANGVVWLYKALTPGENSFTWLFDHIFREKVLNALWWFIRGVGDFNEMKRHTDVFISSIKSFLSESRVNSLKARLIQ